MNYYRTPEAPKPKGGMIDRYVELFNSLQGRPFCYSIREMTLAVSPEGVPQKFYLVMRTSSWQCETANPPEALREYVEELNEFDEDLTLEDFQIIARRINQKMPELVDHPTIRSTDIFILSRKDALFFAACRHLESCTDPHCGWNEITNPSKPT